MSADIIRDDMARLLREAVLALGDGSVKRGVGRCAQRFGLTARRVRAYLHREVKQPLAWEVAAVRAQAPALLDEHRRRADAATAALAAALRALDGSA